MRGLLLVLALVGVAVLVAVLDGSSGIRTSLELHEELRAARSRIEGVRTETERLRREAEALEARPFAVERAIREDLGLARPGETIVRISPDGPSNLRFD